MKSGRGFFSYVMKHPSKWCGKTCTLIQRRTSRQKICPIYKLKTIYANGYTSRLWPRILSSFIALCIDLKRYDDSLQKLYNDQRDNSKREELTARLVDYLKEIMLPKGGGSNMEKIADLVLTVMSHPFFGIGVWKEIAYENLFPIDMNIEKSCREKLQLKGGRARFKGELLKGVREVRNDIKLCLERRKFELVRLFSKLPLEFKESWKNPKCYTRMIEIGILYYYKNREKSPGKPESRQNLVNELKKVRNELNDLQRRLDRIEKELSLS